MYLFWFFFVALAIAGFKRSNGHPDDAGSENKYLLFLVLFVGFHGSGARCPTELIGDAGGGHFESPESSFWLRICSAAVESELNQSLLLAELFLGRQRARSGSRTSSVVVESEPILCLGRSGSSIAVESELA